MGVPPIQGFERGSNTPWAWNASNQSTNLRFGALVAISLATNATELDVLLYGETDAGDLCGVCLTAGPEPTLTYPLPTDGVGVTGIAIGWGLGRSPFILSPNQTVTNANPYLIPDPAVPGNVISRPIGSTVPPVARALQFPASSSSEQYIVADYLPALGAGLGGPKQVVTCDATDAPVDGDYVPLSGIHVTPAASKNTPVVFRASKKTVISLPEVEVAVAPGGSDGARYQFKAGATAALANAATPGITLDISGTATNGTVSSASSTMTMNAGDVLVIGVVAIGDGIGATEHSTVSFQVQ